MTVTPLSGTPLSHQIARLGAEHPIRQLLLDVNNPPQSPSVQYQQQQPDVQAVISKLLLKAASKDKKEPVKMFTIRNLNVSLIKTCDDLKNAIRRGLSDDITINDFDVGYIQGTNVVRVRTLYDLSELWVLLRKP